MSNLYDENMGDQTLNVSSTQRMFQSSIVVKQDAEKSGILSFLQEVEKSMAAPPQRQSPQTMRPTTSGGPSGGASGGSSY